ncbi:MAG: ATP-binding protein [Muribaculaceae bacterium]|nr:ATP-binding protein [Muribaculaceae bacterium]
MKKGVIILMAMLLAALGGYALDRKSEIAKLRRELSQTQNPKDSIEILYNIFDLSESKDFPKVLTELDGVAARTGENRIRLEIVRHLANYYKSDSLLSVLEAHVRTLPPSEEQKEAILFVQIRRIGQRERHGSEKERQENIARIIAANDTASLSKYEQIARMFNICEYMGMYAQGPLLVEYLDDLNDLIERSQIKTPSLKTLFLNESANIYTGIDQSQLAVEADRKLLKIYENLEKQYKAKGRKYRNYDLNRYYIYRRMLGNYRALTLEEANDIYKKIMDIVNRVPEAKAEYDTRRRAPAYHAMKNGQYAEALRYLKEAEIEDNQKVLRRHLLEMMIEAGKAVGDTQTVESASKDLEALLAEMSSEEAKQRNNELSIRYEVSALRAENAELELENKNEQIKNSQRTMTFVVVGWALFIILAGVALFFWTRYRRVITGLNNFIDTLQTERDAIKERRYYDYDNADADAEHHKQIYQEPAARKNKADKMVDGIINDVLFISSIAMEDSRKFRQNVKVHKFMEDCISTVAATLTRNVNVNVTYPEPDFTIRVDKECLQLVTDQILGKALILAPEGGSISFSCALDEAAGMARFMFKHSGTGLPQGKEERIFENFFEYEKHSEGGEGTLLLCRLINFLSSCSLKSSTGRANVSGGQLVLMVPLD